MSIVAVSFHGFLIILLSNVVVNGSLIRLFCQHPNSELCKMHHRRNSLNRYFTVTDHNSEVAQVNDEPLLIKTIDEDINKLRDQLEGKDELDQLQSIEKIIFYPVLAYRLTVPTNEGLVRCINLGDDSCNNGSLPGSGKDDDFLNGSGNPGKRSQSNRLDNCMNLGDEGCLNGSLPGTGKDGDFLNGSGILGKHFY